MGVYAMSYPGEGVGQIWKQYLEQLKNYAHLWKLKHCANADADAKTMMPMSRWQHKLSRDIVPAS